MQTATDTRSRSRSWFRRRGESRALTRENVPPQMLGTTVAGESITPASSLALLDVFAAVRRLSDGVSSMPLIVYRKRGEARERAEGATADLLHRPAPATTQASLIGTAVAHLATTGNSYLGKVKAPEGQVVQLVPLAPERTVPEIRAGVPIYTYTDLRGARHELTAADVIHRPRRLLSRLEAPRRAHATRGPSCRPRSNRPRSRARRAARRGSTRAGPADGEPGEPPHLASTRAAI